MGCNIGKPRAKKIYQTFFIMNKMKIANEQILITKMQ